MSDNKECVALTQIKYLPTDKYCDFESDKNCVKVVISKLFKNVDINIVPANSKFDHSEKLFTFVVELSEEYTFEDLSLMIRGAKKESENINNEDNKSLLPHLLIQLISSLTGHYNLVIYLLDDDLDK
jgi:hypothetical protein